MTKEEGVQENSDCGMTIERKQTEYNVEKIKWKDYEIKEESKRVRKSKNKSALVVRPKLLVSMYKEYCFITNSLDLYFPSVFVSIV